MNYFQLYKVNLKIKIIIRLENFSIKIIKKKLILKSIKFLFLKWKIFIKKRYFYEAQKKNKEI